MLFAFDATGEEASWAFEGKPGSTALEIGWNMDSKNGMHLGLASEAPNTSRSGLLVV